MTKSESNEMQPPAVFLCSLLVIHLVEKEPGVCDALPQEEQKHVPSRGKPGMWVWLPCCSWGDRGTGTVAASDCSSSDGVGLVQDS